MTLTFVHVHGRGSKPDGKELAALWREALRAGIERFEPDRLPAFDAAHHEFAFYGDILNTLLETTRRRVYDPVLDLEDLRTTLERLKAIKRKTFASRAAYERLPGRSSLGELIADAALPMMRRLRLSDDLLDRMVPDIHRYLVDREGVGNAVRSRVREALERGFAQGGDVVVVAHCLGSVAAFDVLWSLSHAATVPAIRGARVKLLVTLGSPLGDETVKARLLGGGADGRSRYPSNVTQWVNIAAEDDWVSHDNAIADDYREMLKLRLVSRIDDHRIHNFAVRFGRSNPHSALGYLIHPRVARTLALVLPATPA